MNDTQERFLNDVKHHNMDILQNRGEYRHLHFQKYKNRMNWFDLITWPGYLCIAGEHGTYVFSRITDMFDFFRLKENASGDKLTINPVYWAEKAKAVDRTGGIEKWSIFKFKQVLREWLEDFCTRTETDNVEELWEDIKWEIFQYDSQDLCTRAAMDYAVGKAHPFHDVYHVDCNEYDYSFLWCLYAIVWGIRRYDKEQNKDVGV